jgi:uncharacterized protein involved in outer membrane biogenesis
MRWIRLISLTLLAVVLLFVVALVVLVNLDANRVKGTLEHYVADQTGRRFEIQGDLDIDFGRHTRLTVDGVHLGNPEWAAADEMVQVDHLTVIVELWSLVDAPLVIRLLELSGTEVNLEQQPDGTNNWTFGDEAPSDTKPRSKPLPLILELARVDAFQLTYRNPDLQAPLQVQVDSFEQTQVENGLLDSSLQGSINTRDVTGRDVEYRIAGTFDTLKINSAGRIDDLLDPTHPELTLSIKGPDIDHVTQMLGLSDLGSGNMDMDAALVRRDAGLEATIHGNLGEYLIDADGYATALTELREAGLTITASGPNLGQAARLFGFAGLPDDPFDLAGNITRSGKLLTIEELGLNIGGAHFDLSGSMSRFPKVSGAQAELNITGSDIARFRELLGLPGVATGPFDANAKLQIAADGTELFDVQIRTELGRAKLSGTLGDPPEFVGTRLAIELNGNDLQDLGQAAGIPFLIAGPFELTGEIEVQRQKFITRETLRFSVAGNALEVDGTVGFAPTTRDTDIRLKASGPDLSRIAVMANINEGAPAQPFTARGRLQVIPDGYRVEDFDATIGEAKISLDGLVSRNPDFAGSAAKFMAAGPDLEALLADTEGFDIPPGPFRASGNVRLGADEIDIENLEVDLAGAELRVDSKIIFPLGWSDFGASSGQFLMSASGPDLSAVLPEFDFYQPDAASVFSVQAAGKRNKGRWTFDAVSITLNDARLGFAGQLDQPPDWSATELILDAQIDSLARLGLINGRRLPDVPLELDTHFTGAPGIFEMDKLTARLGDSDFSGQLALSLEQEIPDIDVRIDSNLLDLDAFADEDRQDDAEEEPASQEPDDGLLIPEWELPVDVLRKFNARLAIEAKRAFFRQMEFRDLALYTDVRDGALNVQRAEVTEEDATLAATFAVLPDNDSSRIAGSVHGTGLRLGLFGQSGQELAGSPRSDVDIDLTGTGQTLRELAATLNARVRVISKGGRIPNNTNRAGSILYGDFFAELVTTVNPFAKEEPYTNIVCYAVLFDVIDGMLTSNPGIVIQTDKMNIASMGTIDLVTERLDLNFKTASRGRIGLSAGQVINPFIRIAGTMADPKLQLDPQGALVSGGAAVITLGLSILAKTAWDRAFREKDPCGAAIAEAAKRETQ